LPQQEPGPAQPAKSGVFPQQDVSCGPGMLLVAVTECDDGADKILVMEPDPQAGQAGSGSEAIIRISAVFPHSEQMYSKIGINRPSLA